MTESRQKTLKLLGIFVLVLILGRLTLPIVDSPKTVALINSVGPWGPVVVVTYVVATHVFAPLAGSPMFFVSATVYGMRDSIIYFFIGGLFSSVINFWIARRYGRKWVLRLAGKHAMDDIDNFAEVGGTQILFFARLFGVSLFDFISYAAGLTKISFKTYYLITVVLSVFHGVFTYYVYRGLDFGTEQGITIWLATLIPAALLFTFVTRRYLHKKVQQKRAVETISSSEPPHA
ncbi:hypothetical protein A2886_02560 [candidate division WWE3 bacterium RIFCSPHIGHO2_01_FULL_42_13]|uniref:TVP38/TMEM64 family membrane protein n=1 Tax=candidate division WWE3 bacterium RIFCSPHIGHO2_01_FULL_42_13 TaxID=1802617 RepID=A0A1F4UTX0_UNCKA|nr:MAG: hypothetical protein A2886_02560 [candidate division WWE3 bacterium RIFCSPHIGHO2_01_FULL_42_13]